MASTSVLGTAFKFVVLRTTLVTYFDPLNYNSVLAVFIFYFIVAFITEVEVTCLSDTEAKVTCKN